MTERTCSIRSCDEEAKYSSRVTEFYYCEGHFKKIRKPFNSTNESLEDFYVRIGEDEK